MKLKILFTVATSLLSACSKPSPHSIEGFTQGTTYHISYWPNRSVHNNTVDNNAIDNNAINDNSIAQAVSKELATIDAGMSGYRSDSTIERFNQNDNTETQWVGAEIATIVRHARTVSQATDGCYDPTIKPLFDLWGFSTESFAVPENTAIKNTLLAVGMDNVIAVDGTHLRRKNPSVEIDLSSIAQGYSVARLAQLLESYNIHDYLVEIGGELVVKGSKADGQPWRVAIEKPLPEARTIEKVITITAPAPTLAVMTSGTYRHFYDDKGVRYSHILDSRTGYPVTHHTVSVTVLYPDAALADAWSTALLCLGQSAGVEVANKHGIPALFIEQNDSKLIETYSLSLQHMQGIRIE